MLRKQESLLGDKEQRERAMSLDSVLGGGGQSSSPAKPTTHAGVSKFLGKVWLQSGGGDDSAASSERPTPRLSADSPSATVIVDTQAAPDAAWERLFTQKAALPEISTPGSPEQAPQLMTQKSTRLNLPSITSTPSQRHVYDFFFTRSPKAGEADNGLPALSTPSSDDKEREKDKDVKDKDVSKLRRKSFGQQGPNLSTPKQQSTRVTVHQGNGIVATMEKPVSVRRGSLHAVPGASPSPMVAVSNNHIDKLHDRKSGRMSMVSEGMHEATQAAVSVVETGPGLF